MKWITVSDTRNVRSFAACMTAEAYMFRRASYQPRMHVYRRWILLAGGKSMAYMTRHSTVAAAVTADFPFFLAVTSLAEVPCKIQQVRLAWVAATAVQLKIKALSLACPGLLQTGEVLFKGVSLDELEDMDISRLKGIYTPGIRK